MVPKDNEAVPELRMDTYDGIPQVPHLYLGEEHVTFYENDSTSLTSETSENPHVAHDLGILSPITNTFSPYLQGMLCPIMDDQYTSNLLPKITTEIPNISANQNLFSSLPNFGLNDLGNTSGSEYTDTPNEIVADTESLKTLDCSITEVHTTSDMKQSIETLHNNHLDNVKKKYLEFLPLFSRINGQNFKELLVKVSHDCLHQVPLDNFYNLLYNSATTGQLINSPKNVFEIDKSDPNNSRIEGLNFCRLVLETFRLPPVGGVVFATSNQQMPKPVNFHEVCKNFLAMKIILDSVIVNKNTSLASCLISKTSLYKAYCIICKKLIQKYSHDSKSTKRKPSIILNQSQLGKIIKLTFPNLNAQRYGKRGDSRYYYQDLIWNDCVIDEEIKSLLKLSLPDIESNFERLHHQRVNKLPKIKYVSSEKLVAAQDSNANMQILSLKFPNRKPVYSFVYMLSTLPVADCFPRSWVSIPGHIPQQSPWAKATMDKSVEFLKRQNVDIDPLIRNIEGSLFRAESLDNFFEDVLHMIQHLMDVSASEDLYLHLYLVVSTLIFPIVFASEKEVSNRDKCHLRICLSSFVIRLEAISMEQLLFCNLMGFVKIMKNMISYSNLLLLKSQTSFVKNILRAMIGDAQLDFTTSEVLLQDMLTREALRSCNAFSWEFLEKNLRQSTQHQIFIVKNIVNAYLKFVIKASEKGWGILSTMTTEDLENPMYELLYYIFLEFLKVFHEIFFTETSILQLPIKLIDAFLHGITREIHEMSFRHCAKREPELSKEISKAWWAHLNLVYEYMNLLSEITALSVRLDGT